MATPIASGAGAGGNTSNSNNNGGMWNNNNSTTTTTSSLLSSSSAASMSSNSLLMPDYPVNEDGWPLSPDGYELREEVGQGAFAKVQKGYCPSKKTNVAVKIMALENITTSMEEIQSEVKAMKLNRHEAVLGLYCCFVAKSNLWLVMPLMDKGSCYYILRSLRKMGRIVEGQGLPEEVIAAILRELLEGLSYIHGQGQIHRDIKAGNILLNAEGRVAIADFGVAGWMTEVGARAEVERKTFVGTPCWMAPEVMEQMRGYNEKADIWSVGITALELAKGYAPYAKYAPMQVLIKTIREPPPSIKSYVDAPGVPPPPLGDKFHKFVARCLQKDPKLRPSAQDLLSDPFIKKGIKAARLVELLKDIPAVGVKDGSGGGAPVQRLSTSGEFALVPGTTWVFPDELLEKLAAGGNGGDGNGGAGGDGSDGNGGMGGGGAGGNEGNGGDENGGSSSSTNTNLGAGVDGPTYATASEGVLLVGGAGYGDEEEDTSLDAIAAEIEALGGETLE